MTEQKTSDDQVVHVPRYAFEALAAFTALGEDMVAVMLLLLMRMDRNRAARIDMSLLHNFLTLSHERVERAVSLLIKKGWVNSVDEGAMRRRILDCVVHPAFIHADFDTLLTVIHPHLRAVDFHHQL